MTDVADIPISDIAPNPRNPRERFDESKIEELADSIDNQGLLQPVLVRPLNGEYELVHGGRRLRAVKQLEKDTIRAEIRDLSDEAALEISISENLHREDVSPIAEAESFAALIDEFGLTQAEVADRIGKSQSHIANRLKLLDLPERLQDSILRKILSPWQARELGRVWDEYWLWDLTVDHDLTVRELRQVIADLQDGKRFIRITREWPIDALIGEAFADSEEIAEAYGDDVEAFDIGLFEWSQARLWANEHIDGFDKSLPHDSEDEILPILYEWATHHITRGHVRVKLAADLGYDGEFQVDMLFPRSTFAARRNGGDRR